MKKQATRTPTEILTLCFQHFPQFRFDLDELLKNKIIAVENKRLVWNYDKTSLGEYFRDQKGPAATNIEGGFWCPVESCFLIKGKDGIEAIKRGTLRHLANRNGRLLTKPSRDYEKLMEILKPGRNQPDYIFKAIKMILAETDERDNKSMKKTIEMIKKLFTKNG